MRFQERSANLYRAVIYLSCNYSYEADNKVIITSALTQYSPIVLELIVHTNH